VTGQRGHVLVEHHESVARGVVEQLDGALRVHVGVGVAPLSQPEHAEEHIDANQQHVAERRRRRRLFGDVVGTV
jgi:hypothetical protein